MLREIEYNRSAVFSYAREWAFGRNPAYYNFDGLGGDCTNFASQCVFAGAGVMNYKPVFGWYYKNPGDRTPSWTGAGYFNNFLMSNRGEGPYGTTVQKGALRVGDIVQLKNDSGVYYHSLVVVERAGGDVLVAAHTYDAFLRPLSTYSYAYAHFIRIGVRKYIP